MWSPMAKSLKRRRPMSSEDEEDEISLREVYKRIKTRRLMSTDVEEEDDEDDDDIPFIRSAIPKKEQKIPMRWKSPISFKRLRSPLFTRTKKNNLIRPLISIYEQEEEEKKKKKMINNTTPGPIPVFQSRVDPYYKEKDESDEETLGDGDRDEKVWDCKFEINQDKITYTRVTIPERVYYKKSISFCSVLRNRAYPVPTLAKMALDRYNVVEGTDYQYVGLVKAYKWAVNGFHYTIRFKAGLPDQHPIYLQAMIYQRMPTKTKRVSIVDVNFVYPLPPMSQKVCRPLS